MRTARQDADRGTTGAFEPTPAIGDYALIGDCRTAALLSRDGSIDWLCLPDFSSPSVFGRIIDERGGRFSITPRGAFRSQRRYLSGTAVVETTFETDGGIARVRDLMPIADGAASLEPMREILRIIEGVSGNVQLEITLDPQPDYRQTRANLQYQRGLGWRYAWSNELLLLNTGMQLAARDNLLSGTVVLQAGDRQYLSLAYVKGDVGSAAAIGDHADARCERTVAWWREWASQCTYSGRERETVLRSAVTLKLLTFCLSGAIVAAPTTSLPEALGGERNWDYRYCWLRDAGMTMGALAGLGFLTEAGAYLNWLLHATGLTLPELSVLYDVYGRTNLDEKHLDHFGGYRNSRPVRIGNQAISQLQLDVYGQVAVAADVFADSAGKLGWAEARMLPGFGDVVCKRWREPDNGIWESPDPRRQFTFSKVMCWVALDRLLSLDRRGLIQLGSRRDRFGREREAIGRCIEEEGFNRALGSYTSELSGSELDAALLLMVCFGYKDAREPRILSTYERIHREPSAGGLNRGGLLYRNRPGYDGFPSREGAFGICSFWAIDHLANRGEIREAEQYFDHLLSFANDLGLFGEEIDPDSGMALGNFPQAFTHVGVIYAALSIDKARRERRG